MFSLPSRYIPGSLLIPVLTISLFLTSCTGLLTDTVIKPAIGNLQQQTDINLVCEGAPAYLLMLDSMLANTPGNKDLLLTATQSFSAYAEALTECGGSSERIEAITDKAHLYGKKLLNHSLPLNTSQNSEIFDRKLATLGKCDIEKVFWGTFGWITWVRSQKGSPGSIADLVIIEKIMARLLKIDESFQNGSIHLFFGGYYAAKPAILGGRMDLSKIHFEKALALGHRKLLVTQVTYAETYARMTMDKELHDNLLKEVLAFPLADAPESALVNRIAKNRAQKLLDENYFGE